MENLQNYIHLEFPIYFIVYLIIVYFIGKILKKLIGSNKILIRIQYLAVVIHEMCHFVAAFLCLKIPKFNPIKIESSFGKTRISGSVNIKVYPFRHLIYNLVAGEKVTAFIFLLWEVLTGFIVGLAPIIFPFILVNYLLLQGFNGDIITFLNSNIVQILLLLPIFIFFALVSNLSKEDISHALPGIFVFLLIPMPKDYLNLLELSLSLMLLVLGLSVVLLIIKKTLKKAK